METVSIWLVLNGANFMCRRRASTENDRSLRFFACFLQCKYAEACNFIFHIDTYLCEMENSKGEYSIRGAKAWLQFLCLQGAITRNGLTHRHVACFLQCRYVILCKFTREIYRYHCKIRSSSSDCCICCGKCGRRHVAFFSPRFSFWSSVFATPPHCMIVKYASYEYMKSLFAWINRRIQRKRLLGIDFEIGCNGAIMPTIFQERLYQY